MATAASPPHWTFKTLVKTVTCDEQTLISWLQTRHLLADHMDCCKCGSQCRLVPRRGSLSWRCPEKGCQCFGSIRKGSFFSRNHLKLDSIVELMYYWSKQVRTHYTHIPYEYSTYITLQHMIRIQYITTHPHLYLY